MVLPDARADPDVPGDRGGRNIGDLGGSQDRKAVCRSKRHGRWRCRTGAANRRQKHAEHEQRGEGRRRSRARTETFRARFAHEE